MGYFFTLALLAAALCIPGSTAAPLPDNYLALATKYAPQLRFAKNEQWWPSSVDYMFQFFTAKDGSGKTIASPSPLTSSNIDQLPATTFLSVSDTSSNYVPTKGQNPSSNSVPIYTFIVPKENGIVDFFYWVFNPFNVGKNIIALGQVGNHVGDWERMTVRTVNGVAVSADYNAHSSGHGVGTVPWSEVKKVSGEDRPLGYVAYGSHGIWPAAGNWVYEDIVVYKLSDKTEDGGVSWDTKNNVVPIVYKQGGGYGGSLSWLDFKGMWGNKGQTNCWWHFIVPTCGLSSGPGGPAREDVLTMASRGPAGLDNSKFPSMDGPLTQTLAPLSTANHSTFEVNLSSDSAPVLTSGQSQFIGVEVLCKAASVKKGETKGSEVEKYSIYGFIEVQKGLSTYQVPVDACGPGSTVDSYRAGACEKSTADTCSWSAYRELRTYIPGKNGVQVAKAVEVVDYDVWRL